MNEDAHDRHSRTDHDPQLPPGEHGGPSDAGAYIGHEPEFTRETEPGSDAGATETSDQPTAVDDGIARDAVKSL